MRVILFQSSGSRHRARLRQALESALACGTSIACTATVPELAEMLRQTPNRGGIVILLVTTPDELESLLDIKGLFWNHQLILIHSEIERQALSRASGLFPRYMAPVERDFSETGAVLARLIANTGTGNARQDRMAGSKSSRTGSMEGKTDR